MKKLISISAVLLMLSVFPTLRAQETSADFEQLIDWLTGEYESKGQVKENISNADLSLKITRIWPEAANGVWLYVEHAYASAADSTASQHIYFLSEINDSQFSMDVYSIPGEEKFVGAWENPEKFEGMTAFDLKHKNGCTLFLDYDGFQYSGATNEGTCKTDVNGAAWSTSKIILLPGELSIWERGMDADGNQVWGPTNEPYIFKKQ